jgi:imidazole glycerol-phosphate synthase subunit HisH
MIGILDLDMGNLRSVFNAVYSLGYDVEIVDSVNRFDDLSHLIIPGVGSFNTAANRLDVMGLKNPIISFAATGRPVLGICLGMHVLADWGEEGGKIDALGLIPGSVTQIPVFTGFPIPHVGWNSVHFEIDHPVFFKVKNGIDCYFVHSYQVICSEMNDVYATTDYKNSIVAIAGNKNTIGFQFHPEKSQANGLKLLENFCEWSGEC